MKEIANKKGTVDFWPAYISFILQKIERLTVGVSYIEMLCLFIIFNVREDTSCTNGVRGVRRPTKQVGVAVLVAAPFKTASHPRPHSRLVKETPDITGRATRLRHQRRTCDLSARTGVNDTPVLMCERQVDGL